MTGYPWKSRLAAAVLFAVTCGSYLARTTWHEHLGGRAAYLQNKAAYFDKSLASTYSPTGRLMIHILAFGLCFAIYEIVAFGITQIGAQAPPMDLP